SADRRTDALRRAVDVSTAAPMAAGDARRRADLERDPPRWSRARAHLIHAACYATPERRPVFLRHSRTVPGKYEGPHAAAWSSSQNRLYGVALPAAVLPSQLLAEDVAERRAGAGLLRA